MRNLLLILCLAVFQPAFSFGQSQTAPSLRIGLVLALTGPASVWGNAAVQGALLAKDELSAGPISVEIIISDSASDAKSAVTAWKHLVEQEKVDAVIGDVWAFLTNPLIPLAGQKKVLLISPTVVEASVEVTSPYFYTLGARAAAVRGAIDKFFALHPEAKTASIIFWDDPWGRAYLKEWKESAANAGVSIIQEFGIYDWAYDYRTEVSKIAQSKPDIVIGPHHMDRILKRMSEAGLEAKVLTTSNILEPLSTGSIPAELAAGVYFTDLLPSEEFRTRYRQRWGEQAIAEAHNSYDAVRALARAAELNRSDLREGLSRVKLEGTAGLLDFTRGAGANAATGKLRRIERDGAIVTPD